MRNSVSGIGRPELPRMLRHGLRQLTTGLVSVRPYPTSSSMPTASKNASMWGAMAPPPLIG